MVDDDFYEDDEHIETIQQIRHRPPDFVTGPRAEPPASQLYYWTREWQADEQRAVTELARGEGREFDSATDAIRWLLTDDD